MRAGIVAVVLAVGCGGDGVEVDATRDNVCGEIAKVACHDMYRCCSEGEIERFLSVDEPRTEAECQQDVARLCARQIAAFDFAIDERRMRFDAGIMNRCLEALVKPSDSCASVVTELPWEMACEELAWVGLVENGGRCLGPRDCASRDSFCSTGQVCTAKPGEGQPCTSAGCATGYYCAGTCRPQQGPGGACVSALECRDDLFCDFDVFPSACAEVRGAGEPCTSNASCASGQCTPGTCAGAAFTCFADEDCSGRCEDDGGQCVTDGNCGAGTCSGSGTSCTTPGSCPVGQTCNFPVRCLPGACVGDIVCTDRHFVVDYCEDVLGDLPIPR